MPTPHEILDQLKKIKYPGFSRDIVSFGMIKDVQVATRGVTVVMAPVSSKPEVIAEISTMIERAVTAMAGVAEVRVEIAQPQPTRPPAGAQPQPRPVAGVRNVIAVASGKGGVGKSTVAVNMALAMASLGWRIGLLDADVYGPSVAMMVGAGERIRVTEQRRIVPLQRFGIRYVSMALFVDDDTPVIWRGPMVTKLESEFLFNVDWGDLDCLVLDLPPGTGDAQLTITQRVTLAGGVIVTTPQELALIDVKRGVAMFQQAGVAVIGVIENMSYHICRKCGHRHEIFAHGGGTRYAETLGVPFLGELPLVRELREGGDTASPIVVGRPEHSVSASFRAIASTIIARLD